ncbi:unnamed protein product [Gongylonema pulchrum]|uniref:Uncharacterized protein n=1 Tax=Gongylonema pulchrum TaxID=637853 RepID=A0A183ESU7_9BILA|nr:unnamed protein product [Gongylonema pulchrum]
MGSLIFKVMSRRGSRMSQSGSGDRTTNGVMGHKSERSPSQPDVHFVGCIERRWRSPTICAETFEHDRLMASKKRISIIPDPPSVEVAAVTMSYKEITDSHHTAPQVSAEHASDLCAPLGMFGVTKIEKFLFVK